MRKKALFLLLILAVLMGLSGYYVVEGTWAYVRYQQKSLADREHCGGQDPVQICVRTPSSIFSAYYPSYVATQHSIFTIDYRSSTPMTLLISVSINRFSQVQTRTLNATPMMQSSQYFPALQGQILRNLTTEVSTSLHIEAKNTQGHVYYVNDIPLQLHSRRLMEWSTANRLQIAAWVTPDDAAVAELVKKATSRLKEQEPPAPAGMIGYTMATPQLVRDQVNAIYDTLRLDYRLKYVQASVPYNGKETNKATQDVKLPAEVLQQGNGMCVDMTVLLASAVERIGLHAAIIIVPGHAFLGVAVKPDKTQFEYWDTIDVNTNVAADSSNVAANNLYQKHLQEGTIIDTILISDARHAQVGPML